MSPHSTLQAAASAQPYATSLQLLGSNYLTAAAAAAAAAAATSTLCQHNQQTNSTSSSINLSLGASVSGSSSGTTMSSSSSSTTTRYMSLATTGTPGGGGNINDTGQSKTSNHAKALASTSTVVPPTLALANGQSLITPAHQHSSAMPLGPPPPLLIPPSALKMEEWSSTDFMTAASKTTTTTLTAAALSVPQPPPPPAHFDHREKHGTTLATTHNSSTNLLELSAPTTQQALNLMRLPTPPTSATIESAAVAAAVSASATPSQLPTQLLFQTATPSPTPTLLNLSATLNRVTSANTVHHQNSNGSGSLTPIAPGNTTPLASGTANGFLTCPSTNGSTLTASIGPPTPLGDDITGLHFKTQHLDAASSPQIVVGVPRIANPALPNNMPSSQASVPQMQDVNIQTDTPVCSEDENSSCPLNSSQCHGANTASNSTEQCTTAQCTPPLTQNDELYHDTEAQEPLELTKPHPTSHQNRSETPQVESSSQMPLEEAILSKSSIKQQPQCAVNETFRAEKTSEESNQLNNASTTPAISSSTTNPEEMTGLELLSNISTSSLAKTATIRVKQEPLDTLNDTNMCHLSANPEQHVGMELNSSHLNSSHLSEQQNCLILHAENLPTPPSPSPSSAGTQQPLMSPQSPPASITQSEVVEPLGGLKLLCALAEQRIQEEEEVQSTTMNATAASGLFRPLSANSPHSFNSSFGQNAFVKPCCPTSSLTSITFPPETQNSSFPSLETLELPSTSTGFSAHMAETSSVVAEAPVKRKKHKHSKSSKSSTSANGTTCGSSSGSSSKKSQKCSKKNKKKYSKEKKRHKLLAESQQAELDFDDPQLQQELQKAFQNCVDPSFQRMGKWPTPQEIFSIMENSMRMRLADITRQYRKKKRKLDEISKNKKKKKCSKLQASQQQQISLVGNTALSLAASEMSSSSSAVGATNALSSSPLCDYKFGKFSTKSASSATTTNYLAPSSFIRFATTDASKSQNHHHHQHHHTHPQFPPPPDIDMEIENATTTTSSNNMTPIYKPVRLEPSSLDQRSVTMAHSGSGSGSSVCSSNGVLRLAQKHSSSEKHSHVIVCKEPRLSITSSSTSRRSSGAEENEVGETNNDAHSGENEMNEEKKHLNRSSSDNEMSKQICVAKPRKMNPIDRSLMLTQDHLYRHETRVLTDMGGLFYAGIMKPLQPPDVYAITLDGERGNKSHIMSREEIFKDTVIDEATFAFSKTNLNLIF